ncbi:uncharacterized protein LOC100200905 isoform X2 [Hydra vulgaris]|nr:uncharacterized protein LOC100200905 isoform X2 [Hydra vulgaris]XP_047146738.1 uncharacterized protein LOC100200905 isoform X2 [Hydra vulgaris]
MNVLFVIQNFVSSEITQLNKSLIESKVSNESSIQNINKSLEKISTEKSFKKIAVSNKPDEAENNLFFLNKSLENFSDEPESLLQLKNIIAGIKFFNKTDLIKHMINNFSEGINFNEIKKEIIGKESVDVDVDSLNLLNEKLFASKRFIQDDHNNLPLVKLRKLQKFFRISQILQEKNKSFDPQSRESDQLGKKIKLQQVKNTSLSKFLSESLMKKGHILADSSKRQNTYTYLNLPSVNQSGHVLPSCSCFKSVVLCNCYRSITSYKSMFKEWIWGYLFSGFAADTISTANVGIIIDESIDGLLLSLTQRFIFNLLLLLKKESYISIATAGKSIKLISSFQTFNNMDEVKEYLLKINNDNLQMTAEGLQTNKSFQINSGTSQVNTRSSQINSDTLQTNTGSSQINTGISQINTSNSKNNIGNSQTNSESSQINTGSSQISTGNLQINAGSSQTSNESSQINTGSSQIYAESLQININNVLTQYYSSFEKVQNNGNKNILFLFLNKRKSESEIKIEIQSKYRDINIFVIKYGSQSSISNLKFLTNESKIFIINLSNELLEQNMVDSLMKYEPVFLAIKRSIYKFLSSEDNQGNGLSVNPSSKSSLQLSSSLFQSDWWYKEWNWNKYMKNLNYEGIGPTNLAFVVDGTNSRYIIFIQRLVFNYIRLFQLQGTFVTIAVYGKSSYVITKWKMFTTPQDVQKSCESIPLIQGHFRETADALENIYSLFLTQKKNNNNPCVLVLIVTGSSEKHKQLNVIGGQIRAAGVRVYTMAIASGKASTYQEINEVAYSEKEQYVGSPNNLVTMLSAVKLSLVEFIGRSQVKEIENLNEGFRRLQTLWNWRSISNNIQYGYISQANVGILVDGTIEEEYFDTIRRLVYNIMKCYSLAGTHFNVASYATSTYETTSFRQYRSGNDIKKFAKIIPKLYFGKRNTGGAMWAMLNALSDAPPDNPSIVYIITAGPSADDVIAPSKAFRMYGIIAFACSLNGRTPMSELSSMSFTSSTVFSSPFDGLINLVISMTTAASEIIGTVSKACGPSGHLISTNTDIMRSWQWQSAETSFSYSSVNPAEVGFLIDSTSSIHFDLLQKFTYNIFKLFAENSTAAIVTYGGTVDLSLGIFRQYTDNYALQTACSTIFYKGEAGRRIGSALSSFHKLFPRVGKKILFLITMGKSEDDVNNSAKQLALSGVSIFTIGIGEEVEKNELKSISRFYLTTDWNNLITVVASIQNSLTKVFGSSVASVAQNVKLYDNGVYLGKMPPLNDPWDNVVFNNVTDLKLKWNWNNLLSKIKYGALEGANVVILVDVSISEDLGIMRRFLFNIIKLFQESVSTFTVVGYSQSPNLVFGTRKFNSDVQIRRSLEKLESSFVKNQNCNIGSSLAYLKDVVYKKIMLLTTMNRIFGVLVSRSSSSDNILEYADSIKGAGITMVAIGIGQKYNEEELKLIATNGQLIMHSSISALPSLIYNLQFKLAIAMNIPKNLTTINQATLVRSVEQKFALLN